MIKEHLWSHLLPFVLVIAMTSSHANADYSMNIQLSSERVNEGGNVTVTCDVIGQQTNTLLSVVWAKRTIDGEQFEIGTERNMTERFQKTQRYAARRQLMADPKHIKFSLTINDLKSGDSGEIGCSIPSHRIHIFKAFTVLVPVKSVRLRSSAVDKSRADAYNDNQNVSFPDGAVRQFFCDVTGSFPQPEVSLSIGDRDLTSQFSKTETLVYEGPTTLKGVQGIHYDTDLSHPNLHVDFGFGGKTLSCVANLPDSSYPPVTSSIHINFLSYRPKFIDCSDSVVVVKPYQKNIRFECYVQAVPAVSDVRVKYDERRMLRSGNRDGHYHTSLVDQPLRSLTMKKFTFTVDKIYPQHIRDYTFVAINDEGETELQVRIVRDAQFGALSVASRALHCIPTLVVVIILALALH